MKRDIGRLMGSAILVMATLLSLTGLGAAATTLNYWMMAGPEAAKVEEAIMEEFKQLHPDVEFEVTNIWGAEATEKVLLAYSTGLDVDVLVGSDSWTAQWARAGLLENIQPYYDRDFSPGDFFDATLDNSRVDGKLYGLTNLWTGNIGQYRPDLFDNAGVPYPTETWTWDDMAEAGRRLTHDRSGDGVPEQYGLGAWGMYDTATLWWENGAELFNDDYTVALIDSPEAIEATEFVKGLYDSNIVAPHAFYNMAIQGATPLAYQIACACNINHYQGGLPFDMDVAPVPVKEVGGPRYTYGGTNPLYLWSKSKNKELAWEFLKFRISPEITVKYNPNPGSGPAMSALGPDSAFWDHPAMPSNYQETMFITAEALRSYAWGAPNWVDWVTAAGQELSKVWAGDVSPAEGHAEMARLMTMIVNRDDAQ